MWTQSINITDLRKMDECIREVMNRNKAKYKLQINSSLYLRRDKGGRGLRNMEMNYKCTKIKTAIKVLQDNDPKMVLVRRFDIARKEKRRKSFINDAILYAKNDFDSELNINQNEFTFKFKKDENMETTSDYYVVANYLKEKQASNFEESLIRSTWQGLLIKERLSDPNINTKECFMWNCKWKTCPIEVVNDIQSIYLQTIPTLAFQKYRGGENITSTNCRICKKDEIESIKHILSHCEAFLNTFYKRRHDRVLQHILYNYLFKQKLLEKCPPWFSKIEIKSKYENDDILLLWDIPEYSGREENEEVNTLRPDGKLILKNEKVIYILEQTVPWISNRDAGMEKKENKYRNILRSIKLDYPDYEVSQLTFIIDCLGGYDHLLKENIGKLGFTKHELNTILIGIQKIVMSEARETINHFKILTIL